MSNQSSSGGSANVYRVIQVYSDSYTTSQVDARNTPLSGSTTPTTRSTGGSQADPNRISSLLLSVDYLLTYGSLTSDQKRYLEEVRQTLLSALQGETSLSSSYIQDVESRIAQWKMLPGDVVNASDVDALGRVVSRLYTSGVFDDATLTRMKSVVPPPDSSGAWFWDSLAKDPSSFQKALNAVRAWVAQLASNALALASLAYKRLTSVGKSSGMVEEKYAGKIQALESDIAFLASVVSNASSASPQTLLLTLDKVINLYLTYKSAPLSGEDYINYLSQLYAKAAEKQSDGKLRDALQDMSKQLAGMTRDRARDLLKRFFLIMDFTPSDIYNQIMGSSRSQLQALAKYASGQPMTQAEIEQAIAGYLMLDAMDKQGKLDTSKLLTPPSPGQIGLNPLQGLISNKTFTDAVSALSEIESYIMRGELPPRRELGLLPVSEALGFADVLGKIQQSVYNGFMWLATKLGMKPEEASTLAMAGTSAVTTALLYALNFVPGGQFISAGLIALGVGNMFAQIGALAQTPQGREILEKYFTDPYVLASIAVSALASILVGKMLSERLGTYQAIVQLKMTDWINRIKEKLGVTGAPQYAEGFYVPTEVKYKLIIDPDTNSIMIRNDVTGEIYSFETYDLGDLKKVIAKDRKLEGLVETFIGKLAKNGVKPDKLATVLETLNNIAKNGPDVLEETVTWINQALEEGEGILSVGLYAGKATSLANTRGSILVFTGDSVRRIPTDIVKTLKDSLDAVGLYKVIRLLDINEQEVANALATARMNQATELTATVNGKTVKLLFTPDNEYVNVWVENPSGVKTLLMKVASKPEDLLKVAQIYKQLAGEIGEEATTVAFDSVIQLYSQRSPYISSLQLIYPWKEGDIQADLLFNLPGKEAWELLGKGKVEYGVSEIGIGPGGYYIVNMQLAKTPSGNPMDIFYGETAHVGIDKTGGVINKSVVNVIKLSPEDFGKVASYILEALGDRSLSSVPMKLVSGSPGEVASIIDDAIRLASASGDQSALQYLMLLKTATTLERAGQGGVVGFLVQSQGGATVALAMPTSLVSTIQSASLSLLEALQLRDQSHLNQAVDIALSQVKSALVQSGLPQDEALVLAQQVTRELLKPYNVNVVFLPAPPVYVEREVEVPATEYKSVVEIAQSPTLKGRAIIIQQPEIHREVREVEVPVVDYKVIQEYVEPLEYRGRAVIIQKPQVVTKPVEVEVSRNEYKSVVDYTDLQMTGRAVYVPIDVTIPVVQVMSVDVVEESTTNPPQTPPTPTVTPSPTPAPIPPSAPFTGAPATGGQPPPKGRRQLEELII